jgi:hypothetical protein
MRRPRRPRPSPGQRRPDRRPGRGLSRLGSPGAGPRGRGPVPARSGGMSGEMNDGSPGAMTGGSPVGTAIRTPVAPRGPNPASGESRTARSRAAGIRSASALRAVGVRSRSLGAPSSAALRNDPAARMRAVPGAGVGDADGARNSPGKARVSRPAARTVTGPRIGPRLRRRCRLSRHQGKAACPGSTRARQPGPTAPSPPAGPNP